jgi:hypothetical protein
MMNETFTYLIRFLLGEDVPDEISLAVGYTADPSAFRYYSLVIVPSGFFDNYGKPSSLPSLPLAKIKGIPLLFGTNKITWIKGTMVVFADLVASTYFLITRYEEMVRRDVRDEHGRFPGKESLPYRAGFMHRPVIDEYRMLLCSWLRIIYPYTPDIKPQLRHIWLTHDVDAPFLYRSWKGVVRSILDKRGIRRSLRGKSGNPEDDPYYNTFPWLFEQDKRLAADNFPHHTILFFKAGGNAPQDKPHYRLQSKDLQQLMREVRNQGFEIGLHASYRAGMKPSLIAKEKEKLEKYGGLPVRYNRHHFLAGREPEDLDRLEAAGFTDDFTMGYADVAGFRLGTSYPVRWINPVSQRLSSLLLHPLTVMDCTLESRKYMGLTCDEAAAYCLRMIDLIKKVGGEVTLLWHNSSVTDNAGSYLRTLYAILIDHLVNIRNK